MRLLLDVNVILDVLLERSEWLEDALVIWNLSSSTDYECCVAASSLTDVYYIARRFIGRDAARLAVGDCIDALTILTVNRRVVIDAYRRPEGDIEDAILISAAVNAGIDAIVTRDQSGFTDSPILAISPGEFIESLASGGDDSD